MKRMMASAVLCLLLAGATQAAAQAPKANPPAAQSNQSANSEDALAEQVEALNWTRAPATVSVGTVARVALPPGTMYLGPADANRFVTMLGNPPMQNSYVIANSDLTWFAVFSYDASGYVRDNEQIDPAALLTSLREMEVEDNQQRTRLGLDPMYLEGWAVEPHYDRASHNLEWGTRLRAPEGPVVNYTTRLLGRGGVVVTILVTTPDTLQRDLADFRRVIAGFSFVPGQTYAEFRDGDRVAEYGLAALVTGGAAAAAAKGGLFKALGGFLKLIIVGVIALFAAIAGFFRRLTGRRQEEEEASEWQ